MSVSNEHVLSKGDTDVTAVVVVVKAAVEEP